MKSIKIAGKEYPIEYTVEAQAKVAEKAGDINKIADVIKDNPCFLLAVMMEAAQHRNEVFARISGKEAESVTLFTEDELKVILTPAEQSAAMKAVMEVMTAALKADVETVPEKGKKTKSATRSE